MVMLCGWEGNRRSGVALAMRTDLVVYPPMGVWAQWLSEEISILTAPSGAGTICFIY